MTSYKMFKIMFNTYLIYKEQRNRLQTENIISYVGKPSLPQVKVFEGRQTFRQRSLVHLPS